MFHSIPRSLLFSALLLSALGSTAALAQSGSSGGSIGNDEKSLSGSRAAPRSVETDRPARRSKPEADEPRRAARKSGGGGSVDGAWVVTSVGCGGTGSGAVVITSGRIIGEGLTGFVSPSGAARSVFQANGLTSIGSGRLSGRSGSGTFRRSDGCGGTWSATKQ
ncbi:hypothetical protein V5279_19930 [Bradyrhizobium sp. 26S5]|uniref:hypothetical protein n=1 Tax=Bradyrhizobium sp. 26S5 TaxID=3139729 RepID=UPI0030D016AA